MNITLFNKKYWVRRFKEPQNIRGYITADHEDFVASLHIHPMGSDAMLALPEGERKMKHLEGHGTDLLIPASEAMPAISSALSTISGDKVERMMRRLLIDQQNISVQGEDTDGDTVILDKDLADEVFCGELQDMFILCYEVIKLNFKGFFKRVGIQSGSLIDKLRKGTPTSENGETSTSDASASLS